MAVAHKLPKIAVIDDSAVELQWATQVLRNRGFEVVTYNRALGFQAFVAKEQPTLILLDVNMPALNGDMVCRLLRKNPHTSQALIALYSSVLPSHVDTFIQNAGADAFILKNHDEHALVEQIINLLP